MLLDTSKKTNAVANAVINTAEDGRAERMGLRHASLEPPFNAFPSCRVDEVVPDRLTIDILLYIQPENCPFSTAWSALLRSFVNEQLVSLSGVSSVAYIVECL